MKAVVSVKELMQNMIDPVADNIFDAVWWNITPKGIIATEPKTDDDWEKVKTGAVTIAEGAYLLKVPRSVRAGRRREPQHGTEVRQGLSPAQIQAKLDKDPVLWQAKIEERASQRRS